MSATLAEDTSMPDDLKELLTRLRGDRALLVAGEEATVRPGDLLGRFEVK